MKRSATGRILFWRGGSLWIGLAGEPTGRHAHHAVQLSLAFPAGRVRLQGAAGRWSSYGAALVAAHVPHAFDARAQHVAQIFVDPESLEGRALQRRCGNRGIVALTSPRLAPQIAELAGAYETRKPDATLIGLARSTVASVSGESAAPASAPDARITRVLELVRQRLGDAIPLRSMAAAVHLSPDRFRHLFVKETGVTFRPFLLWLRLESSLAAYVAGASLTAAAQTGGFADSAHFSRTFRRMFGIAPASVRPE